MSLEEVKNWVPLLNSASVLVLLVLVLYGGLKKWWVYGWLYEQTRNDLREAKDLLYTSQGLADRALRLRAGPEA